MSQLPTKAALQQAAELCVKCGVCLPHCPTFALRHDETESPRGRISLLQGLASERLPLTRQVTERLGHCLSCGRCEEACPANVPYTNLMDGSRFLFQTTSKKGLFRRRMTARMLASPGTLRWLARLARLVRGSGIARFFGAASFAGRALAWMPERISTQSAIPARHPGAPTPEVQAIIFPGCITSAFERDIVDCARRLGRHLGIGWHTPQSSLCCGALYQHLGDFKAAQALMDKALLSFAHMPELPIATLLSGCGKGLYENLGYTHTAEAQGVQGRMIDIHTLLVQHIESLDGSSADAMSLETSPFTPAREPVAVYLPCSTSRDQKQDLLRLLKVIPNAQVHEIGKGLGCCGASGDHMTTDPAAAALLAAPLIREIINTGVSHLVVANLGCAWHLRAALRKHGASVSVIHPLQWLSAHLQSP